MNCMSSCLVLGLQPIFPSILAFLKQRFINRFLHDLDAYMFNIYQRVMDTITLELEGLQTKITTEAVEIFRPVSKHRMAVAWLPEDT